MIKNSFYPLVSIIIPVYNGANYLKEAIDSALFQTYKHVEIVVVNDGSTDNTEGIIKSYGNKLRYYKKENGGVASALNFAIKKSKGEYVSWLSHDDLYVPEKIEKQIIALKNISENKRQSTMVYGNFITFYNNEDKKIYKKIDEKCKNSIDCLLAIDTENTLHGCSLLIPKIIFNKYGLFDEKLKYTQDYDMWSRLLNKVDFVFIDDFIILSRQHSQQNGITNLQKATLEADKLHSNMICQIKNDSIDKYINNSFDNLKNIYLTYKKAKYSKTASQLLKHLTRISIQENKIDQILPILNKDIFNFDDSNKIDLNKKIINLIKKTNNKPSILIYTNVWTLGGVERFISIVSNYLKKKYNIVLVYCDSKLGQSFKISDEITSIKISDNNEDDIPDRLSTLSVLLNIDVFIGNPNIFPKFLKVYKILSELNIKTIACNHNYYFLPYLYPKFQKLIVERLSAYKYANVCTWSTRFSTTLYRQLNQNVAYIPNPNTFTEEYLFDLNKYKKENKIILCVGRFYDQIKRLDRILVIFKKILKKHHDAKLVLVGGYNLDLEIPEGSGTTVRELIQKLNLPESSFSFVGEKSSKSLIEYYKKSSLLILTSEMEGFGMVLVEANHFGLPVISFENPGIEDIVIDNKNGFVVSSIKEMADKINLLFSDKKKLVEMSKESILLSKRFNQKSICKKWEKLIDTVLSSNDQKYLNKKLEDYFPSFNNKELPAFTSKLANEYEKYISILLKSNDLEKIEHKDQTTVNNIYLTKNEKHILDKIYSKSLFGRLIVRVYLRIKKTINVYAI